MEKQQTICKNCDEVYDASFKFCPHCGQKSDDKVTLKVLFYNTISNYFSFDARFLKSFLPLLFRPGFLARKFIDGKRLLYLHPAQMYLFVSVIFFFVFSSIIAEWEMEANEINQQIAKQSMESIIGEDTQRQFDSVTRIEVRKQLEKKGNFLGFNEKKLDSVISNSEAKPLKFSGDIFDKKLIDSLLTEGATDEEIYKAMGRPDNPNYFQRGVYKGILNIAKGNGFGKIIGRAFDAAPISMFFLLPFFAFILKLFYLRRGPYSHHLVFSFYYFSFLFTLFALLLGIEEFVVSIPDWVSSIIVLSTFVYFFFGSIHFYKQFWFWVLIKSGIIAIFFSFLVFFATLAILAFGFINT